MAMDSIRRNYDRVLLVLGGVLLTSVSALLGLKGLSFNQGLERDAQGVPPSRKVPVVDVLPYEQALAQLEKSSAWRAHKNPLFVSDKYLVKEGRLVNPLEEDGLPIHPPVPNKWFEVNNLDLLDPKILSQDQDKDGFSNLEEFDAKTDPQSVQSHPEYITKLRLKQFIRKPFRFVFKSWYGNPEQIDSLNFQIETVDLKQPTQFVKMDGVVKGTDFKVVKFEFKNITNANQIRKDVSEITLQNQEGENMVLPLEKVGNLPANFGKFILLWNNSEFEVKNNQEFSLEQAPDKKYKVIDISSTQALVMDVSGGQSITVPLLEPIPR